jgi:uncharacterized coiled-coil protein SlyX
MAMPDTERLIHLEQQIIVVDQKISRVSDDVRAASEEARQNGDKMNRILSLLLGNVLDKNDGGVLGRIEENKRRHDAIEKRVEKLEEKFKQIGWTIAGACIGSGIGGYTLAKIIELLTHKK